ncbi:18407_t:CDS:2 [Entrophospora sp. SA101]|nr:13310_t:CDS:2 [Entrophospora sp. SA101]CAJ0758322.1 18407_t:CDS:2 [Entrophospora sp. SA101]CAJ0834268.1 11061_t:CDS:2 [Entrophospora sp. SA101]
MISLLFVIIGLVNGQDVTPTDTIAPPSQTTDETTVTTDNSSDGLQQITAQSIVAAYISYLILIEAQPQSGYTSEPSKNSLIILLVSLAIGFIVGMLLIWCATVAIWLLGLVSGWALANFILALADGGLIKHDIGRIVFIVTLATLGLILTCIYEDVIITLGTSFIGAYAMILGIDIFVNTGFLLSTRAFLDKTPYATNQKVYLMMGGLVGLFIVGLLVQFKFHRNIKFGPRRVKGYDRSVEDDHTPVTKKSGYASLLSKK